MLIALLSAGFYDGALWFLPIVVYLTVWIPQVARKAASPRQAILVSAMFTGGMIASLAIQEWVLD